MKYIFKKTILKVLIERMKKLLDKKEIDELMNKKKGDENNSQIQNSKNSSQVELNSKH